MYLILIWNQLLVYLEIRNNLHMYTQNINLNSNVIIKKFEHF